MLTVEEWMSNIPYMHNEANKLWVELIMVMVGEYISFMKREKKENLPKYTPLLKLKTKKKS